jgi:hypothetical protein
MRGLTGFICYLRVRTVEGPMLAQQLLQGADAPPAAHSRAGLLANPFQSAGAGLDGGDNDVVGDDGALADDHQARLT